MRNQVKEVLLVDLIFAKYVVCFGMMGVAFVNKIYFKQAINIWQEAYYENTKMSVIKRLIHVFCRKPDQE